MPGGERVAASGRNLRTALIGQILIVTVNLISRRIFIRILGSEYMGLSGLCGHLLNILSLLEPGFDAACIFALYRPLAFGDKILTAQICAYLKRIYRIVAAATLAAGALLTPLALRLSDSGEGGKGVLLIWLLSVADMSLAYLFSHRKVLPFADQKAYVITTYGYVFFIIGQAARLFALVRFGSFISYLLAGILSGIAEEIMLSRRVRKMYPYLENAPYPIPGNEKQVIHGQVRALFFHKVGGIVQGSVDNMAVFTFLGLSSGAVYSNYTMLSGTCLAFIGIITGSIGASVGNLGVVADKKRMERVFSTSFFAVFLGAGFLATALYFTYPTLMRLWMGEGMVLGLFETALFCVSMFVFSVRRPIGVFLDGCGLFEKEKYKAITEAAIGCVVTFTLAPRLGISGVLIGQIFGAAAFSFWYETYVLYRYGFYSDFSAFLRELLRYIVALFFSVFLSGVLCNFIEANGVKDIFLRIGLCAAAFSCVFGILFFDNVRLRDTVRYARRIFNG